MTAPRKRPKAVEAWTTSALGCLLPFDCHSDKEEALAKFRCWGPAADPEFWLVRIVPVRRVKVTPIVRAKPRRKAK